MSNQSDVSSADGEVCGLGGSNTGNFCHLRDEVKEGRGGTSVDVFLPPSGFHVPSDVSPLKQRYAVGGISAFTQRFQGAGALIHQGWIQEREQRLLRPGTEEALG